MRWCTPGYVLSGHPRGAHEVTDPAVEIFDVVSSDDGGTAGFTSVCADCLRDCVIVGEVKYPARMRHRYFDRKLKTGGEE